MRGNYHASQSIKCDHSESEQSFSLHCFLDETKENIASFICKMTKLILMLYILQILKFWFLALKICFKH